MFFAGKNETEFYNHIFHIFFAETYLQNAIWCIFLTIYIVAKKPVFWDTYTPKIFIFLEVFVIIRNSENFVSISLFVLILLFLIEIGQNGTKIARKISFLSNFVHVQFQNQFQNIKLILLIVNFVRNRKLRKLKSVIRIW